MTPTETTELARLAREATPGDRSLLPFDGGVQVVAGDYWREGEPDLLIDVRSADPKADAEFLLMFADAELYGETEGYDADAIADAIAAARERRLTR